MLSLGCFTSLVDSYQHNLTLGINMAYDINSVLIVGRLTRDVELSYTPTNNTPVAKFGLANNSGRGDSPDSVSYFEITAWNKVAETCNQYLQKGRQVVVQGRLQQDRFQDKMGQNRSQVKIIATSVQFVGGRGEGMSEAGPTSSSGGEQSASAGSPSPGGQNKPSAEDPFDSMDFGGSDEEIPF